MLTDIPETQAAVGICGRYLNVPIPDKGTPFSPVTRYQTLLAPHSPKNSCIFGNFEIFSNSLQHSPRHHLRIHPLPRELPRRRFRRTWPPRSCRQNPASLPVLPRSSHRRRGARSSWSRPSLLVNVSPPIQRREQQNEHRNPLYGISYTCVTIPNDTVL